MECNDIQYHPYGCDCIDRADEEPCEFIRIYGQCPFGC